MDVLSPAYVMLIVLLAGIFLITRPAKSAVDKAKAELSDEDLQTFRNQYASRTSRATMPAKFDALVKAQERVSRIWIFSMLAVLAGLVWVIVAGPGLGLFPDGSAG
ncbi:MAG: hypothetical protein AAGA87_04330 [Pseudomonadota bacterium]